MSVLDFSNLTATAVLCWYAWYTASRVIPALVHDFRVELARQRAAATEERDAWRAELAAERDQRHNDNLALVVTLESLRSTPCPAAPRACPRDLR